MLKKNRRLIAVLLAAVLIMAWADAGCGIRTVHGPDLEEPVIVEELCWFSQDRFSFSYIYDEWKEVKEVEIPALENARFSAEMLQDDISYEKYTVFYVDVHLDEPVKKDTVIDEITIIWDDGTETTVGIGQATLLAGVTEEDLDYKEGYDILEESGGSVDAAEADPAEELQYVGFSTSSARRLTDIRLPSEKAWELIEFMRLEGADLDEALPLELPYASWYQIEWSFSENAGKYGVIQIPATVMAAQGEDEIPAAVFDITWIIDSNDALVDYLKQAL